MQSHLDLNLSLRRRATSVSDALQLNGRDIAVSPNDLAWNDELHSTYIRNIQITRSIATMPPAI
jgi:hypothetical protein